MNEIVFEVTQEGDGGFVAECLQEDIFTQGDSWEDLKRNVREATHAFPSSFGADLPFARHRERIGPNFNPDFDARRSVPRMGTISRPG